MRRYYYIYYLQLQKGLNLFTRKTSKRAFASLAKRSYCVRNAMWLFIPFLIVTAIPITGLAQEAALPSPQDIQRFGYSFLTGDTAIWEYIQDDDIYHLSKSINLRDSVQLQSIRRDDFYFLGLALVKLDKTQLEKLHNDDLYFLGSAILERTIAYLENVKSDEFHFLGRAIVLRNIKELDNIKPKN